MASSSYLLSCDWGTSSFRLRVLEVDTQRLRGEVRSSEGASVIAGETPGRAERFAAVLRRQIAELAQQCALPLAEVSVVISGMASSSIGWQELPYGPLPVGLDGNGLVLRRLPAPWHDAPLVLVSGLATDADVLRGEECEALGLLQQASYAAYRADALLILPGTHAKHVRIQDGAMTDFASYMTGELYALLTEQSILRHSVQGGQAGADLDAFRAGVLAAQRELLPQALFHVRARQLLHGATPDASLGYLNGLLLGTELRGLAEGTSPACPILLCAGRHQSTLYACALETLGLGTRVVSVPPEELEHAVMRGHLVAWRQYQQGACA